MMNTKEKRFRRTFLLGLQALGVFADSEQWKQFKVQNNVDGPFEELLGEGKFDEGLCVFRAHAPFGEVDHQRVPEILSRALPRAIGHKFTESSLQNLLLWIEDEITPQLHSSEARGCLRKLTHSVARDVAYKALASVETKGSSDTTGIIRSLKLASTIAGCGSEKGERTFQELLTETIELINEHGLLRPSRVILQSDEMPSNTDRTKHVYFSDIEAMLLRGVDNIEQEMTEHIRPWCKRVGLDADEAILSFLANPDLVEDERWTRLLDLITNSNIRVEATILFLRKAQPPFEPFVYKVIEDAMTRDPSFTETWQKESRALDIRGIAAKYGCSEWFDLSKHLRMLQMHVCATAASCKDVEFFTNALEDVFALCTSVELPNIASHLLGLVPECGFAFDPITYVELVTSRLTAGGMRYSVVQEAIQACVLGIQSHVVDEEDSSQQQMDQAEEEEEEESAEERYAHLGLALVRFAREELDLSVLYVDLGVMEDTFQHALVAATRRLSLNSSTVSDLGGMANVNKTVSIAEMSNLSCGSKEALNSVIIMNTEAHCLPDACDRLSDALVLFDVKEACNKSLVSSTSDSNDQSQWAFRDCPNVIYSRDFCPKLQVALDESRSSAHNQQHKWTRDSADKDLETVARSLDVNGALQASFRVRAASYTRWFSKSVGDTLEDLMFRMASAALHRPALDERLIFGYLTSLSSKDSATLVFKAETKRLNDEFLYLQQVKARQEHQNESNQEENKEEVESEFDFGRFERLSCLGKNIGKAFAKKSLLEESQRNERTAKWLLVLSNRISLDKLRFIRAQSDYLLSTASQLFSSFFSKSDFSFTESKLDQMKEFVNDFGRELNMKLERCLSHCMCDLLSRIDPSHYDQGALSDTLARWSRHADVDYLIEEVNSMCLAKLSAFGKTARTTTTHQIKSEGLDGSQYASLIRIATELLLNLAPERDSFLKRTQLLDEPWVGAGGGDSIARLIHTPIEALLHAKVHQPQNRMSTGGNSLLDVLAMVHSALEMESSWDAFCVEYCQRFMELEQGKVDFKESLLPILDSVSSSNEHKWQLLLSAAGFAQQPEADSKSTTTSLLLQSTKDRLLCLKYIIKNQKRVPSKLLNPEALELLQRELEIRFLFERLNIPFHDSELNQALLNHQDDEQQKQSHMATVIIRLLLERASLDLQDADVFEAARLIIRPQTKTALLACVKRLILDWIIVPFGFLPVPERSIASDKENLNNNNVNATSSCPLSKTNKQGSLRILHNVMEENEAHLVRVIARSLRFVGDEESFLRKIAYGQGPRQMFTNLSRTRALKILRLLHSASDSDLLELSRRERMSHYEECRRELNGAWKQIPEQIFGEGVGKLQVAEGLLRDLPDKHPLQSALFVLRLVMDALQESSKESSDDNEDDSREENTNQQQPHRSTLLIKACEAVLNSNESNRFESLLNQLNKAPVDLLQLIDPTSARVWDSLNDHIIRSLQLLPTAPTTTTSEVDTDEIDAKDKEQQKQNVLHQAVSFIGLLERCPHDEVITSNGERLKPCIVSIWPFLARRIEMLLMRINLET